MRKQQKNIIKNLKMKEILEKYCKYNYTSSDNTAIIYTYRWFMFYYYIELDEADMYFKDYENNEEGRYTHYFYSPEKLEMFFKSLQ